MAIHGRVRRLSYASEPDVPARPDSPAKPKTSINGSGSRATVTFARWRACATGKKDRNQN